MRNAFYDENLRFTIRYIEFTEFYEIMTIGNQTETNTIEKGQQTMMYYNLTNKELLDAYNASAEYDESMCCEICTRVGMHEEYYMADGENIDRVMEEAVEQLRASC